MAAPLVINKASSTPLPHGHAKRINLAAKRFIILGRIGNARVLLIMHVVRAVEHAVLVIAGDR